MSQDKPVGYRNPPVSTRFKAGESGNPSGRPKRVPSFEADVAAELGTLIPDQHGGQITQQRQLIRQLVRFAQGGDIRALKILVQLGARLTNGTDGTAHATADRDELGVSSVERDFKDTRVTNTAPSDSAHTPDVDVRVPHDDTSVQPTPVAMDNVDVETPNDACPEPAATAATDRAGTAESGVAKPS